MSKSRLSEVEKRILLQLARQSIEHAVNGKPLPELDLSSYSPRLQEEGASFVTLIKDGELRGCIGTLEPYQPLVQDVCEHAVAAALEDYRFPPVQPWEVPLLRIEVSVLTLPEPLLYKTPEELLNRLRKGVDGVILRDGVRRATFLPQVWEKVPDAAEFLSHLCLKMGAKADLWKHKPLQVFTYQVEEFREGQ